MNEQIKRRLARLEGPRQAIADEPSTWLPFMTNGEIDRVLEAVLRDDSPLRPRSSSEARKNFLPPQHQ